MLPFAALVFFLLYASARDSLRDFTPALPIPIALVTWLTTYSIPRLYQRMIEFHPARPQGSQKEDNCTEYQELHTEPGSMQSLEDYKARQIPAVGHSLSLSLQDHLVVHMERSSSPRSRMCSVHDTDIDLDENLDATTVAIQRMVSQNMGFFFAPPPQAFMSAWNIAAPSEPFRPEDYDGTRSPSPDTQKDDYQSSDSADPKPPPLV